MDSGVLGINSGVPRKWFRSPEMDSGVLEMGSGAQKSIPEHRESVSGALGADSGVRGEHSRHSAEEIGPYGVRGEAVAPHRFGFFRTNYAGTNHSSKAVSPLRSATALQGALLASLA